MRRPASGGGTPHFPELIRASPHAHRRNTAAISRCGVHTNWSTGTTRSRQNPPAISRAASRAKVAPLHDTVTTVARAEVARTSA